MYTILGKVKLFHNSDVRSLDENGNQSAVGVNGTRKLAAFPLKVFESCCTRQETGFSSAPNIELLRVGARFLY